MLKQYAFGIDEREVESKQEIKSISEETTFSEDIVDPQVILATLQELAAGVGYRLRSRQMFAHTVSIKLRFADFRTITRDITLSGATDRDSEIYNAAKDLFAINCGKPPWRLVGVRLSGLRCGQQLSLFSHETGGEKEIRITTVKDGLRNKYGHEMVFHASKLFLKKEE